MHSSRELRSASFAITVDGDPAAVADVLPGFRDGDRLGIVVRRPCGAVGASALLLAAVTAFYDVQRGRGEDFFIYPDYFVFHVGRKLGSHNRLDIWPPHKEVVVADEPEEVLRASTTAASRGSWSRTARRGRGRSRARRSRAPARGSSPRSRTRANGRTRDADISIASNDVAEAYVGGVIEQSRDISAGERERVASARRHLVEDGRPVESYRRIDLDEALGLLAPQPERRLVAV